MAPKFSIQLYSGRKFPPVEKQLEIVEAAGYRFVETFGAYYEDIAATQKLFERHKVTAFSGHISLDLADGQRERVRDITKALGMKWVIIPHVAADQRPNTPAGWAEFGARLQRMADYYQAHDLGFAWHNHDFEFHPLSDGSLPIAHILGGGLRWEADIAWIARGNADATQWLKKYTGRVIAAHIKDNAAPGKNADEDGWADPTHGVLPWKDLWKAAKEAGAEVMVAEHDNPSDFARFAKNAMQAMRTLEGV
jgi:sugar phosphate isomerase/epimerase